MGAGVIVVIVIVALILIAAFILLGIYNGLIRSRVRTREAWSGIDVQLKRRADLVPNLVETVKGYASHEQETFENVTNARADAAERAGPGRGGGGEQSAHAGAALACSRWRRPTPNCGRARTSWQLQSELSDIEEKIAYARQFYNRNVSDFNTKIQVVPNVFIANMFGLPGLRVLRGGGGGARGAEGELRSAQP